MERSHDIRWDLSVIRALILQKSVHCQKWAIFIHYLFYIMYFFCKLLFVLMCLFVGFVCVPFCISRLALKKLPFSKIHKKSSLAIFSIYISSLKNWVSWNPGVRPFWENPGNSIFTFFLYFLCTNMFIMQRILFFDDESLNLGRSFQNKDCSIFDAD